MLSFWSLDRYPSSMEMRFVTRCISASVSCSSSAEILRSILSNRWTYPFAIALVSKLSERSSAHLGSPYTSLKKAIRCSCVFKTERNSSQCCAARTKVRTMLRSVSRRSSSTSTRCQTTPLVSLSVTRHERRSSNLQMRSESWRMPRE